LRIYLFFLSALSHGRGGRNCIKANIARACARPLPFSRTPTRNISGPVDVHISMLLRVLALPHTILIPYSLNPALRRHLHRVGCRINCLRMI
jgi:hypothetical protein